MSSTKIFSQSEFYLTYFYGNFSLELVKCRVGGWGFSGGIPGRGEDHPPSHAINT